MTDPRDPAPASAEPVVSLEDASFSYGPSTVLTGVTGQVLEAAAHLLQADDIGPLASPQIVQASAQGGSDAVDVVGDQAQGAHGVAW